MTSVEILAARTFTNARRSFPLLMLAVSSLAASIDEALAQQALEEIVVTAERREQNLQDVPIAATVFSADDIATKGIDTVLDVQQFVPNTSIMTYNRSTFINIRGVGLAVSAPAANPGVAYYIDGVFVAKEQLVSQTFFDLESMEVLRGPQGTLTGQNSTGGAIYSRSPAPNFDSVSGYVDQTFGDYNWYRTTGAVNVPLGENLAIRVAGAYENRDSYTENIGPSPSEPGSGEFTAARVKLAYQPTDGFGLNIGYEYFDNDTEYNAIKNPTDAVTSDPWVIEEDAITFLRQKGYRGSVELLFDTEADVRFRWISSVQRADQDDSADGDRTATAPPIPAGLPATAGNRALFPGRVAIGGNEFNYVTSEFNVLSTGDAPLQWVVGAYYLDENIPLYLERDNYNTVNFVSSSSTILTESDAKSQALFGQINYKITDGLELITGLRHSEDEFQLRRDMITGPPPPGGFPYTDSTDSSETTGRLGLNFFPSDTVTWYGTYSKGYKPGATNLTPGYPAYLPETNEVLEFGAKTTLLDNRLRLNSAIFYSEIENFQLLSLLAVGGGQPLPTFQNGTKGESQGVELELVYANDGLAFNFSVGYLDAVFAEDDVLNNGNTGLDELVPAGSALPFSPELTISGGVQYDFNVGGVVLTPRFQVSHVDDQYATPFPGPRSLLPEHDVADVKLIIARNDRLRIEAFVNNVFDETYIAAQIQNATSTNGGYIYGAPRVYGARVSYNFR
jgi:iron complex outermembrane receptor protein